MRPFGEGYKATKAKIEKKIQDIESQAKNETEKSQTVDTKLYLDTISEALEIIESPETSIKLKNDTLRTIVDKIVFFRPGEYVEIHYK